MGGGAATKTEISNNNNLDLTAKVIEEGKPQAEEEVKEEDEVSPSERLVVSCEVARKMQDAFRGYLSRQHMKEPLFGVRDARAWFKVLDAHPLADRPVSEVQSLISRILEAKLPPLELQRPNDGVQVRAKAAVTLEDGAIYEGEWDKQGNKHGLGTLVTNDGSKIVGCFKGGFVEGLGRLIQSTGIVFEGEFKEGKLNGNGKIQREKGAKFDGELVDGKIHGKGAEEWPDGTKYEGEYHYGVRHGIGKLTMGDGSTYIGDFAGGTMHGKGELKWHNGNSYKGAWKKNKMHGKGVFTWNDGRVYTGHFRDDIRHGKGKMTWSDGKAYDGDWVEGKQDGVGEFTFLKEGKLITKKARWEAGNRVEWIV